MTTTSLSMRSFLMNRRTWQSALACLALVSAAAACSSDKLNVPNYNNPTVDGVAKDPNGIQLLVNAVFYRERNDLLGFVGDMSIFGREGYNYFTTDGRTVQNYLVGIPGPQRLDPAGFASGNWAVRYQNMLNEVTVVNSANASQFSAAQKAATIGLAKTFRALDLFYIIQTRDTLGAPVEIPTNPSTPAPFVSRDSVLKFVSAMLDDAKTNLVAGGAAFPFTLESGFAGFDTPANFLKFNRAIAAKVLVHRATYGCGATCYTQAIAALGESFISNASDLAGLNIGPKHNYSSAAGDQVNNLSFSVQNYIYAHAQFPDSAKAHLQTNGQPDARFARKIVSNAPVDPPGKQNLAAVWHFIMYPNDNTPVPVIRNEELILLRAEAELGLGQIGPALNDLNITATVSGGLPQYAGLSAAQAFDALVYEKWASTLNEGTRWPDMRRWGRLNRLPLDLPSHFVAKVMPIPQAECDARVSKPNGC